MKITDDYILGLVDGEGCFSFHTTQTRIVREKIVRIKIPAFALIMNERDKTLIESVRDYLGLRNNVYVNGPYRKDGIKRGRVAILVVRDFGSIKNIIIPFFYNRLIGYKGKQFIEWLEKMGNDPTVSEKSKLLYRLYKSGYWDRPDAFNQLRNNH